MADPKRRRFSVDALLSIVFFGALAGHVAGFWDIPRWDAARGMVSTIGAATFDPQSVTVAYLRGGESGVSTWDSDTTKRVMTRLEERWSEATLGRSRITLMDAADLRDVLVLFMPYRVVPDAEALHMSLPRAGAGSGPFRVLQVFSSGVRPDIEYTANVVLHELAHALGCCRGDGALGGHWAVCSPVQIMCAGGLGTSVRTFSEAELQQMGLGR